jgi:hypothetical protein
VPAIPGSGPVRAANEWIAIVTTARAPFVYFPLYDHFEQNVHVRHRLGRHGADRCLEYSTRDADAIAAAVVEEIGRPARYRAVDVNGNLRAAALLAPLF